MKTYALLSTSALCPAALMGLALAASPALAQDTPVPVEVISAEDIATSDDEAIVITGSRIRRPDFSATIPTTSVDDEAIEQSGETNLVEFLQGLPSLVGSLDPGQTSGSAGFIGSTGLNLLNLRNLGVERTLVLVDGRRHIAALPESAAIDIGTIPKDLIERIDVATGGIGAIYGADAVSGVVNFILKRDFEGIVAHAQSGVGTRGSPGDWDASLTAGTNFADGRGNIAIAFEAAHQGRLRANQRDYLRHGRLRTMQRNVDDPFDDPNIPDEVPVTGVSFSDSSRGGALYVDLGTVDPCFCIPQLNPDGSPYDVGNFIPPFYATDSDGTPRAHYIGDIRSRDRRYVANAFVNYKFSDAFKFFGEVKYARGRSYAESQPSFDFFLFFPDDNAFIPDAVRAQMADPFLFMSRDHFDLGVRAEDVTRNTWRTVAGFNGDITPTIRYEFSYVFGQTKVKNKQINNRFNDRFFAAIDAIDDGSGNIVCRSNLFPGPADGLSFTPGPNSGCIPLNLFGEGVADPAAIDWVMTDSIARSRLQHHVISGFAEGTIPGLSLPGGDIGFVVGGEYRKEKSRSVPALEDQLGQTFGNVIEPTDGSFDVTEAFAEIRIPILSDQPFFHTLELNGAARFSDYSTVGSTFSWNASATWAPVRDIRFRGNYARAVRAPNIGELFSPNSQTFQFITDPCDINELNNGSATREANCATLLSGLGVDPLTFTDPNSASIGGFQTGNPLLNEETAKSWTIGAVFQPSFIPGLSLSVDWYDIKIKNAINQATAQQVAALCVDAPDLNNVFCDQITRIPAPDADQGGIGAFVLLPQNVANFRTSGLDFQLNYRLDPADIGLGSNLGTFNVRLIGNYLDKLTFISVPGADVDDDRGEQFAPKWQATLDITWKLDPITINYGFNYFSKTKRYSNAALVGDPDIASEENIFFDARATHDLYLAYNIDEQIRFYVGMNNIFDQKPDISATYPVSAVGRFVYAGVRVGFDNPLGR